MRALAILPALALTVALTGCSAAEEGFRDGSGQSTPAPAPATAAAPAAPTTSAPAPVTDLEVPDVDGRNGAIAIDTLERAGFTNIRPASEDDEDKVVINPANWTVTEVEPGAGETIASDSVLVVTMTKQ